MLSRHPIVLSTVHSPLFLGASILVIMLQGVERPFYQYNQQIFIRHFLIFIPNNRVIFQKSYVLTSFSKCLLNLLLRFRLKDIVAAVTENNC